MYRKAARAGHQARVCMYLWKAGFGINYTLLGEIPESSAEGAPVYEFAQ